MAKKQPRCHLKGCKRQIDGICKCKKEGCLIRIESGGYIARCKKMYS